MFDSVECPYCGHENDMSEGCIDLPGDNKFDHECEECEREFEVEVEFDPIYTSSEIIYEKCERCGTETRDICNKGNIAPYPKHISETKLCEKCFRESAIEELEMEESQCGKE